MKMTRSRRQVAALLAARFGVDWVRLAARGLAAGLEGVQAGHVMVTCANARSLAEDAPVLVAQAVEAMERQMAEVNSMIGAGSAPALQ